MKINYNRLWKLLIDREMTRTELRLASGISTYTLARLGKNQEVTMTTLRKIAAALDCSLDDIVDFIPDEGNAERIFPGRKASGMKSGTRKDFSYGK